MNKRFVIPALLAITLLSAAYYLPGCGLATAPVSVPEAVAENGDFNLDLSIVDQYGRPLDGVLMAQFLSHHFWTPLMGGTDTDERKNLRVDQHVTIHERGRLLELTFSRDAYFDNRFVLNAPGDKVSTEYGGWKYIPNFPVVMIPRDNPDMPLHVWAALVDYADAPRQQALYLSDLWQPGAQTIRTNRTSDQRQLLYTPAGATNTEIPNNQRVLPLSRPPIDVSNASGLPAGTFYITLTRQSPRAINASGEVDPVEVNLPGELTLHVAGADGGFIRIVPRTGYAPLLVADTAPLNGYAAALTIQRERLREMRTSMQDDIVGACEYFFIKAARHYGKGYIAWQAYVDPKTKAPGDLKFRVGFWMQPRADDEHLTWHRGFLATSHL